MKKIFSIAMAILIVFTAAMTAEGERLTTPEELGKIKKAAASFLYPKSSHDPRQSRGLE